MNCDQAKTQLDDYLEGTLSRVDVQRLEHHLQGCVSCRGELQAMRELMDGLRHLPLPPASPGFQARVLHTARKRSRAPLGFAAGFGSAVAAGLLVWVVVGVWQGGPPAPADATAGIQMTLHQERTVDLAFNASKDLEGVTFSLELPAGVSLARYPGQRHVVWKDRLAKGRNLLKLHLIAERPMAGELVATIRRGDSSKSFRVPLEVSERGTLLLPIQNIGHV
ncbi:MAG: zf-HC2 domain-containing protein [Gammaproteobacteria bacterium]|jgi:anti-sigma factor RsiW